MIGNDVQSEEDDDILTTFKMILGGCKMPKLVRIGLGCFAITEAGVTTSLQNSQRIRHMSIPDIKIV